MIAISSFPSSLPGLTRQSIRLACNRSKKMDARVKTAHDDQAGGGAGP
jgi:hypothetical protein